MKFMRNYRILCAVILFICAARQGFGEPIDIDQFSYPPQHKDSRRSCEISNDNAPPWTAMALHIDCSFKDFRTDDLSDVLPLYADVLDLSWNALTTLPAFNSDTLRQLNLMHNNISLITSNNFIKVAKLKELFLNWNSIQTIELNAFDGLAHLQILDLSHNNLHALSAKIFAPMPVLENLSLSWNRNLNFTTGIEDVDFYQSFGVNMELRVLQLEACSLSNLVLPKEALLVELNLRRNQLKTVPQQLPLGLQKLDLSDNLIKVLTTNETELLGRLQELYLEDMPRMQSVAENAFVPLHSLRKVSFQNSRQLTSFDGHAFGQRGSQTNNNNNNNNASSNSNNSSETETPLLPPLQVMIFRGTSMRSFNSTLAPVFERLTQLDLNGVPLLCDCELIWVKQLRLDTNGRCFKPTYMRGWRISQAKDSDFSCHRWPRWVYGLIILGLIILCSIGIYLVVMGLRPNHGVTMRRKVGAGSPYARVTIEPNRQENL